jgi:hypothetical protein
MTIVKICPFCKEPQLIGHWETSCPTCYEDLDAMVGDYRRNADGEKEIVRECDICELRKWVSTNIDVQPKAIDYGTDGRTMFCEDCWERHEMEEDPTVTQ